MSDDTLELTAYNDFLIDAAMLTMNTDEDHELLTTMCVESDDGLMTIVVLHGGHPYDMLLAALPQQREELRPVRLSLTSDTYTTTVPGGSYAERFKAGDETVSEAVSILVVTADDTLSTLVKYTRTDKGLVWQQPTTVSNADGPQTGRLIELLRSGLVS